MIIYSVHLVQDRMYVPAVFAITDKCVFLSVYKDRALEAFEKYKNIVETQKEGYKQYLYMIKNDSSKEHSYTIKKWGYRL